MELLTPIGVQFLQERQKTSMLASTWAMIPKTNKQTNKLAKTEYDTKAYKEDKQFIFKIPDRIKRFEPVKYWLVRKASRE